VYAALLWRHYGLNAQPAPRPEPVFVMFAIGAATFKNDRGGEITVPFLPLASPSSCPPSPPVFPSPPSRPSSSLLPLSPFCPCPLLSCLFNLYLFPFPCSYPLNPAKRPGERCSYSESGQSPAAKRFWSIFRMKSAHPFHFHNDTFVIFSFYCSFWLCTTST